jgi:predicted ribosomally synthesized peptide with SipW-like signal peptide
MIWQSETKVSSVNKEREAELNIMVTRREKRKNRLIKFKSSNKLLISLILLAFITIGAGANTYSWFTSSASSDVSQITVGTFKLDLEKGTNTKIFDETKLQPGVKTIKKTISFINSGDIDMILNGNFLINITGPTDQKDRGDINAYKIITTIYHKDSNNINKKIYSTDDNGVNVGMFNTELNKILESKTDTGLPVYIFKQHDKLKCEFEVVLDGASATKEHQGDNVDFSFTVKARQNVEGAAYPNE